MIKKVNQQVAGANNCSAMETETIQKNGASPKSQTSRVIMLFCIIICFPCFLWGQTENKDLVWDELQHNFGNILIKREASTIFRFQNNSKTNVTITKINVSTRSIKAVALEETIKPNAIGSIRVTYNPISVGPFTNSLTVITNTGEIHVLTIKGVTIIPNNAKKYEHVGYFYDGIALVRLNKKYGFIDLDGREFIELKYDYADIFREDLAFVCVGNKCGYIDKTGKEVIPLEYEKYKDSYFSNGIAPVKLNGKYGFINKIGKVIIPIKYDGVLYNFDKDGFASVKIGNTIFNIDKKGNEYKDEYVDDIMDFFDL
jgi:hypothetical protein